MATIFNQPDPFAGAASAFSGLLGSLGQAIQRQQLIDSLPPDDPRRNLIRGLPVRVAQQGIAQDLIQPTPLTPLQQAQGQATLNLTRARTQNLGRTQAAGGGLDTSQIFTELGRRRDDNRALDAADRAINTDLQQGNITKVEAERGKRTNRIRRNANNRTISQFTGRPIAQQDPQAPVELPTPFTQTAAGITEQGLKAERLRVAKDPVEQLLKKAEREDRFSEKRFLIGDFKAAKAHAAKADAFIKQAEVLEQQQKEQALADEAQSAKATKFGLTVEQIKEETAGRNGGPSLKLINDFKKLVLSLPPADVDIALSMQEKGIPLRAIINRAQGK